MEVQEVSAAWAWIVYNHTLGAVCPTKNEQLCFKSAEGGLTRVVRVLLLSNFIFNFVHFIVKHDLTTGEQKVL